MTTSAMTPRVHHVPGGFVVETGDESAPDALGCVFARTVEDAIARLDIMRAALATTHSEDSDVP